MTESTATPLLGCRFQEALALAFELHRTQVRKGGEIPYISHLLAVAALVLEHGGTEEEAIAALLHDAAEDQGGAATLARIGKHFGPRVAELVRELSDSVAEPGQEDAPKEDWRLRKKRYLAHLATASASVRLLSAADKLHNLRALVADLRAEGDAVWQRFNAPRECQLWFYREFYAALAAFGRSGLVDALGDALLDLEQATLRGGLAKAIAIAARAHLTQVDKAGAAYVLHPLRLMVRSEGENTQMAAVLHDVVEDGDGWSLERLAREGFPEDVVAAISALTKGPGEEYPDFIERAARNPIARRVKLLDLEDNLDLRRLETLGETDLVRLRKYHASRLRLLQP